MKEKHGHIDALFANAGWGEVAPLGAATEAHFDKTFDLNAKGTFFTVQKAIPLFKDGGSIILNTSVANVMGLPTFAVYAASKAAVRSFLRAWTVELKTASIRVNAISPGPIETQALEKAGIPPEHAGAGDRRIRHAGSARTQRQARGNCVRRRVSGFR